MWGSRLRQDWSLRGDGWEGGSHGEPLWTDGLEAKLTALKATSLDLTSDLTGMCAGGGAAEDVFRPGAWWHHTGFGAKTSLL